MKGRRIVTLILTMLLAAVPAASFGIDESGAYETANGIENIRSAEDGTETEEAIDPASEDDISEEAVPEETPEKPEYAEEKTELKLRSNASADVASETWTAEDFTYEYKSKLMYGCDYTRQFYVNGQVITGFSEAGLGKLDPVVEQTVTTDEEGEETVVETIVEARGCTDLVIPSETPDGEAIVGIGPGAFKGMHLTSVTFPTGMLVRYDDTVTHAVTRRGNFIIHESAFASNDLTEVYLPAGILGCMANSFQRNKIKTVTLPRTLWWIETLAFANNEITKVNFPQSCDFRMEMHGMTFADNNIRSVRLPDYTEVVNKDAFAMNPGMEPMTEEIARKRSQTDWEKFMPGGSAESGIVYMYTDREALFDAQRIHTIDRPTKNQWSPFQKLVLISEETPDADTEKWSTADFTYSGTTVTGLSVSGIEKRKTYTKMDIPDRTPDGRFVSEIASTDNSIGGLFGEEIKDENGNVTGLEGFDVVTLPSGIRKIGDRAFAGMGLKEVVFPNQLQEIGLAAFQNNELEDVILPDSVTAIGGGAFASNPKIKKIIIPQNDDYTVIEGGTFGCSDGKHWMTGLTSIEIPDTITEIGDNAFAGNNFEYIEIPASVKSIGRFAFSTKNYLQTPAALILHEGLETIGSRAFRNKKIEKVVLPATLNALPANTFEKVDTDWDGTGHGVNNPLITRVFVTTEEQYNNKEAFPDSDWQKIYLSDPGKWTAEDFIFEETEIDGAGRVNAIKGFSEHGLAKAEVNSKITIPENDDSVIAVAPYAFSALQDDASAGSSLYGSEIRITGLTVPSGSLQYIGEAAFAGNSIAEIELGEGIRTIEKNAFEQNLLTRAVLPSSLEYIGEGAFSANAIDSLVFSEGGDSKLSVGVNAFAGNKLKSLQICDNLDVLKGTAFASNPGMDDDPGVVRIYKLSGSGSDLEYKSNGKSSCQDIRFGEIPPELAPWGPRHFTFSGETITGFSEDGETKLAADPYVVLPGETADGTVITTVGQRAFYDYGGNKGVAEEGSKPLLKGVEFAPSITTIKLGAFQMCAIEALTLPDTIEVMEEAAFSSNYGMKSIVLSSSLKEIPDGVFVTNATTMDMETGVSDLVIPDGVTRIGKNAFRGQHIKNLELPDTLTEIDESAFMNHQITKLEIPASVKKIGERAFMINQENAIPLPGELVLNEGLEEIGSMAFGQTGLDSVEIPSSLKILSRDAFFDNVGQSGVEGSIVIMRTSVPEQAEGSGEYAGIAVTGISPKTGKEGGHRVIYDKMVGTGWSYDDFTYSSDGTAITGWSEKGDQKRKDYSGKPDYPAMIMPDKATYDGDVFITEIADNAFKLELYNETTGEGEVTLRKFDCDSPFGIQRLEFPEKLERIGDCAFEYNNLKAVNLESAEHLTSIGASAFHGNHLTAVTIPDTVNELGGGAFAMNNLSLLTLSENVTSIPQGCFSMNIFMYEIEIPDTVTDIGEEAFAGARLETLEIPESVTRIGKKAFHLHHLTSLHIPGNVKYIDDSAFEGTFKDSTLTSLTIDEGVEYIGRYAFKEALLEEVDLPYSLKDMGVDPFYSNKGKDGSGVVILYSKNRNHLVFNEDRYHGKENGVSKHCHEVVYTGKLPVTITLDVNGGMPVDIESFETDDFGIVVDPLPVPASADPESSVFIGWYTEKEGGVEVIVGSSFAREATIYAHWSDAPFVIDGLVETADADTTAAEESVKSITSALNRVQKEQAARLAESEAKKAADSAEKAERAAMEALRAAEIEDAQNPTEATRAKVEAAGLQLESVRETKARAYAALAAATGVLGEIAAEKAQEARQARMMSVDTVTINVARVNAAALNRAIVAAGGAKEYVTTVILGKKVKKISKNTFKGTAITSLTLKTKKLSKRSVKNSLKGSKVKTVRVKAGSKKTNKKYVKKYRKFFTKKNAGKKVSVK